MMFGGALPPCDGSSAPVGLACRSQPATLVDTVPAYVLAAGASRPDAGMPRWANGTGVAVSRPRLRRPTSRSSAGSVSYTHLTLPTNREV